MGMGVVRETEKYVHCYKMSENEPDSKNTLPEVRGDPPSTATEDPPGQSDSCQESETQAPLTEQDSESQKAHKSGRCTPDGDGSLSKFQGHFVLESRWDKVKSSVLCIRPNGVRPFQSGTAFVGEDKDGTWFVLSALHCFLDEESREITLQRKEPDDLRKTIDKSGGKLLQDRICKYEYWFCYRKQSKHVELRGDMLVANGAVRVRYNVKRDIIAFPVEKAKINDHLARVNPNHTIHPIKLHMCTEKCLTLRVTPEKLQQGKFTAVVYGFPLGEPLHRSAGHIVHYNKPNDSEKQRIAYQARTEEGSSGSPVFVTVGEDPIVIAIHCETDTKDDHERACRNFGTFLLPFLKERESCISLFQNYGLPEKEAKEASEHQVVSDLLKHIIEACELRVGGHVDKTVLYHIATQFRGSQERAAMLVEYVYQGKVNTKMQLTAALKYLLSNPVDPVDRAKFEESCGVGVANGEAVTPNTEGQNGSSSSQISHAQASQRASASVSPRPSDGFLLNHSSLQRDSDPITVAEDNGLGQINEDLHTTPSRSDEERMEFSKEDMWIAESSFDARAGERLIKDRKWDKARSAVVCILGPDKSFGTGFIGEIKDEYFLLSSLHCFLADEKDVDLLLEDPIKLEAKIRTGAVNPPLPEFIRKSKYQFYYMQPDTLEGKQFVAENVGERYDVKRDIIAFPVEKAKFAGKITPINLDGVANFHDPRKKGLKWCRLTAVIYGFPLERRLSRSVGAIVRYNQSEGERAERITYKMRTEDGCSGSPVFVTVGSKPIVVAIHCEREKKNGEHESYGSLLGPFLEEWGT